MKKFTLLLVCLIGMISFTSVASPIDNGEKNSTLNCSNKEYTAINTINSEIKETVSTVDSKEVAYFAGCMQKHTFQHAGTGDAYIKVTCALQSNGTYIKSSQLFEGGDPKTPATSSNVGTSCSCNTIN